LHITIILIITPTYIFPPLITSTDTGTVGDDGTLRIWSVKKKKLLHSVDLGHGSRSVAWAALPFAAPHADADEGGGSQFTESKSDRSLAFIFVGLLHLM